jgi:hypothetical protein
MLILSVPSLENFTPNIEPEVTPQMLDNRQQRLYPISEFVCMLTGNRVPGWIQHKQSARRP